MTTPFQQNKPLHDLCTLGIGGPANYFVEVRTIEEMRDAILTCKKQNLNYFILGKGSNCFFDDKGFNGLVILNKIDFITQIASDIWHVGAGYSFSLLGTQTARQGLSGLEFASGIPGSVGGAVYMNAGANGNDTAKALFSVDFITEAGEVQVIEKKELQFSYRHSSFQNMRGAIVGATFQLTTCPSAREKQIELIAYRKKTQPYNEKSAGCVFRNPDCGHAGALIEQCGLKGMKIGNAEVSELHANFLINADKATSTDFLTLIDLVRKQVKDKTGHNLINEIYYIPYNYPHE